MPRKSHTPAQRVAVMKNHAKMRLTSGVASIINAYPYMTHKQVLICKNAVILLKLILKKW